MTLQHYIYAGIFVCVVIFLCFAFFFSKNSFKAAIASLLGTLGGFIIGLTTPNITLNASSKESQTIFGFNVDKLTITNSIPDSISMLVIVLIVVTLISFGVILLFDNKDKRSNGQDA